MKIEYLLRMMDTALDNEQYIAAAAYANSALEHEDIYTVDPFTRSNLKLIVVNVDVAYSQQPGF